jgi:hypothetical protein
MLWEWPDGLIGIDIKLYKQKIFGITSNFIAVVEK